MRVFPKQTGRAEVAAPTRIVVPSQDLAPANWELAALGLLMSVSALLYAFGGHMVVNVIAPVGLTVILGAANWGLLRRHPSAVLTPLFAFRTAALVYFGVGGFLPLLFDPYTIWYMLALYGYSEDEAAKVNLIWGIVTALTLAGARISSFFVGATEIMRPSSRETSTLSFGLAFFGIGFGGSFILVLILFLGWYGFNVPGSIRTLFEGLNAAGVFLLCLWAFSRGGKGYLVVALLFAANVLLGLITLSKQTILLPQLMISLAYLMKGVSLRRLATVSVLLLVVFAVLMPIVTYGREESVTRRGQLEGGTVEERIGYTGEWLRGDTGRRERAEEVNPLARLSYFGVATYAVSRYDARQPSDTFDTALLSIVPRVIWPSKPILTDTSANLSYELSGQVGSAVSTTVPVDIYWNWGWAGVLLLPPLLGLPLLLATMRSYQVFVERDWLLMPFALIAFRTPLSIDGQFVTSIFATSVMAAILLVVLSMAKKMLPGFDAPKRPVQRLRRI